MRKSHAERPTGRQSPHYRELVHRFNNELQQLAALIRLQLRTPGHPTACSDCAARFGAFFELHRNLDNRQSDSVNIHAYLDALARTLATALGPDLLHFEVEVALDLTLDAARATTLGLIFTEASINAVKHAFDGKTGRVTARFARQGGDFEMTVRDDGKGFDPAVAPNGTGSQMLTAFARQLGGGLDYLDACPGTMIRVRFPESTPRSRSLQ